MSRHDELAKGIRLILQLRRAEQTTDPEARNALADAREFIEQRLAPTVRPATAARLLGVSQTALKRWLDRGDVASVLTPGGRREIPLAQLLDLLDDAAQLTSREAKRPLAGMFRERRRRTEQSIDIERLLPPRRPRTHRAPELHALAYHRLIAERLEESTVERARRRLAKWKEAGRIHPRWASEWDRILAQPLPRIARTISADTPRARELRQSSPFAGELNEHERRHLVEAVERRVSA